MSKIDASALRFTSDVSTTAGSRVEGVAKLSARSEENAARERRSDLEAPLVETLDSKLSSLETALRRFQWPKTISPWSNSRLVVPDSDLEGKVQGDAPAQENVHRYYKYFSRGFDRTKEHTLENGSYDLKLTLGGRSQTLSVDIDHDDSTWDDVLTKVKDAVNNDPNLPVQAETLLQTNANMRAQGLRYEGTSLALSVDRAYKDQDLALDIRNPLVRALEMGETETPSAPAEETAFTVRGKSTATPSTYFTGVFDPNEETTLAQGSYYMTYSMGGSSGTIEFSVDEGDTWDDVLTRAETSINSQQSVFKAEKQDATRIEYLDDTRYETNGVQLKMEASLPKVGERLRISQGQAPDSAQFFEPHTDDESGDPETALGVGEAGEAYIATATAHDWTQNNVYKWGDFGVTYGETEYPDSYPLEGPWTINGTLWVENTPETGDTMYLSDEDANYIYDGSQWNASQDFLDELGVQGTAYPGSDARMEISGEEKVSATGVFSVDQGRVVLQQFESFPEAAPVRVNEALGDIKTSVSNMVGAYNDLRSFLLEDAQMWKPEAISQWRSPLALNPKDFTWLGFEQLTPNSPLFVNGDTFHDALYSDPERAQSLLSDAPGGLAPMWKSNAVSMRDKGLEDALRSKADFVDASPPWRREFSNDQEEQLLDLYS